MELQVGKSYINRDGDTVTITHKNDGSNWPFVGDNNQEYRHDGTWSVERDKVSQRDLIQEAPVATAPEAEFGLEVGKTYRTRDGLSHFLITHRYSGYHYDFHGELVGRSMTKTVLIHSQRMGHCFLPARVRATLSRRFSRPLVRSVQSILALGSGRSGSHGV